MKRFFFIAVLTMVVVFAAFATAKTSWPTTTEVGKFNVSPSWPVEVQFPVKVTSWPFPRVNSWPVPNVNSWPVPVQSWPYPKAQPKDKKRHPAER